MDILGPTESGEAMLGRLVLAGSLVWMACPVHAQTRVELMLSGVHGRDCVPRSEPWPQPPQCERRQGAILEVDADTGEILSETVVPERSGHPGIVATGDGRYVVWGGNDARTVDGPSATYLSYRDRLTNTVIQAFRLPFPVSLDNQTSSLAAHPTEVRVYANLPAALLEASAAGIRGMSTAELPSEVSPQGDRIIRDRRLVDVATDRVVCELPQGPWFDYAFSVDGRVLYAITLPFLPGAVVARIDATTCVTELQREIQGPGGPLNVDPATGRLFVGLTAYETQSLTPLGTITIPSGVVASRIVFERFRPRAYLLSTPPIYWDPPFRNRVDVIDTETLSHLGAAELWLDRRATDIAVLPLPMAPQNLRASVQGTTVRIDWQAGRGAGIATRYRLEAGSAPGRSDLATFELPGSVFSVAGVPPGTYFVRVRGLNAAGAGRPSAEIVVSVPAGAVSSAP